MLNPHHYFTYYLRQYEYSLNCRKGLLGSLRLTFYKVVWKRLSYKLGYTIPPNCIGAGLLLPHYGTIIITPKAKIGENCVIHCCVNIGINSRGENNKGAPVIGNNVYISPGAKLFGGIMIGDNVIIGANAVVNKSFPSNVVIAGCPAKIVKQIEDK